MSFLSQDKYFIETLKECVKEEKEYWDFYKESNIPEDKEICEGHKEIYEDLQSILNHIKTIDDLAQTDEDTITFVFECLESHAETFIIDHTDKKRLKESRKEYKKLQALLDLFFDNDED